MDEQLARATRALAEEILRRHASNAPAARPKEHALISAIAAGFAPVIKEQIDGLRAEIAALRAELKAVEARLPPRIRLVA